MIELDREAHAQALEDRLHAALGHLVEEQVQFFEDAERLPDLCLNVRLAEAGTAFVGSNLLSQPLQLAVEVLKHLFGSFAGHSFWSPDFLHEGRFDRLLELIFLCAEQLDLSHLVLPVGLARLQLAPDRGREAGLA